MLEKLQILEKEVLSKTNEISSEEVIVSYKNTVL
jgi:hypothetical protein